MRMQPWDLGMDQAPESLTGVPYMSGPGSGTRWHTTVWCHPSALTMMLTDADANRNG